MDDSIPIWFQGAGSGSPTDMQPLPLRPKRKTQRPRTPTNANRVGAGMAGSGFDPNQARGQDGKWVQTGMGQFYKPRTQVGPTRLTKKKGKTTPNKKRKRSRTSNWERVSKAVWIAFHFKRWLNNKRRMQARRQTKAWMNSNSNRSRQ